MEQIRYYLEWSFEDYESLLSLFLLNTVTRAQKCKCLLFFTFSLQIHFPILPNNPPTFWESLGQMRNFSEKKEEEGREN